VSGFLFAAAAGFLVVIWAPRSTAAQYAGPALRILLFLLFVRFAVPVLIVGTTLISDAFLAPEQEAATAILRDTTADIERINDEAQAVSADDQSFMDRLGEMIDESLESMRVGDRLQELKESASNAAEHIVSLIAIFVLQTILLPLLFLWLFIASLKGIAGRSAQLFQGGGSGGR
jgi:predicted membrane channel-forming protein YqfA (hemolysin III family)